MRYVFCVDISNVELKFDINKFLKGKICKNFTFLVANCQYINNQIVK